MSYRRCSIKTDILKNFAKFSGKLLCQSLFFNKNTPAQVFSYEFCEIFKNTLFAEHLRATASDYTFIERKISTFRTKTLRINASQIMVLIKESRYLPYFLKFRKNNSNGSFQVSDIKDTVSYKEDSPGSHPRVLVTLFWYAFIMFFIH